MIQNMSEEKQDFMRGFIRMGMNMVTLNRINNEIVSHEDIIAISRIIVDMVDKGETITDQKVLEILDDFQQSNILFFENNDDNQTTN